MIDIERFKTESRNAKALIQKMFGRFKRNTPKDFDEVVHGLHDAAFEKTDCLQCANCCKTTSPIFYQRDIERASKLLKIKPGDFMVKYLRADEENDFVLKQTPCAFLDDENRCFIYEARPAACREYPHTNRKNVVKVLDLTLENSQICPAVFEIYKGLTQVYPKAKL